MADYSLFYYSYSTIAQTLAGAFGFLAAVTCYQLQIIEATIPNIAIDIRKNRSGVLEGLQAQGDWENFLKKAQEYLVGTRHLLKEHQILQVENMLKKFEANINKLKSIKQAFWQSLISTSVTIVFCFILLPLTNKALISTYIFAGVIFSIVIAAAIYCIYNYITLVKQIIK